MEYQSYERLIQKLSELREESGDKHKKLNLRLMERVILRLYFFSKDCKECEKHLFELNKHINKLKKKQGKFVKMDIKAHRRQLNTIISHLHKEHKLVREGYYTGIYMGLGSSFGLLFDLLKASNMGLGISTGIAIGLLIGTGLDANIKKKDLTI